MITFKRNSTNYLRALVAAEDTGALINDANSVVGDVWRTYGNPVVENAALVNVGDHSDASGARWNYEVELPVGTFTGIELGQVYEVIITATKGARVTEETESAEVVD